MPQLKGALLEHPAPLVKVGAVTPEPIRIVESPPEAAVIVRLALKLAVDVGVKDTQIFSVCVTVEFCGMTSGSWISGYSNVNPAPPKVTAVTVMGVLPVLKIRN